MSQFLHAGLHNSGSKGRQPWCDPKHPHTLRSPLTLLYLCRRHVHPLFSSCPSPLLVMSIPFSRHVHPLFSSCPSPFSSCPSPFLFMSIPFSPSSFISNVFPPQSRVFAGWHRCMCWHRCMGWFPSTCSPPRRSSHQICFV